MYEITEQYSFMATHEIHGLPDGHRCSGVHLHRWTAELLLATNKLPPTDGPSELSGLEPIRRYIMTNLDNRHLNDVLSGPPTPVRLATHVALWCEEVLDKSMVKALAAVSVWSDAGSRARFIAPRAIPGGTR
ncbi:MAG TPA: 6-carboxytetrahydropterin synthase [Pseudonocardiaceae bacterium]|nr:6-carboxytetrahydropterin synthase [Pseudonocardiaceae bacterium]